MVGGPRSYRWEWLAAGTLLAVGALIALFFVSLWIFNAWCQIAGVEHDALCEWGATLIYSAEAISFGIAGFAAALTAIGAAVVAHVLSSKRSAQAAEQAAAAESDRAAAARARYLRLLRADAERLANSYIIRAHAALYGGSQWPKRGHENDEEYRNRTEHGRVYLSTLFVEQPLSLGVEYLTRHNLAIDIINAAVDLKAKNLEYKLFRLAVGSAAGQRFATPDIGIMQNAVKGGWAAVSLLKYTSDEIGDYEQDKFTYIEEQLNDISEQIEREIEARLDRRG